METLKTILMWNPLITIPLLTSMIAQILKSLINFALIGKYSTERLFGDGGMPSAHSATVCSLVVAVGRLEGTHSALFALALVFATVTMHDAMGVRRETGEQAKILNKLINTWMEHGSHNVPLLADKKLKEMVGHTPIEVISGAILGTALGFVFPVM